MKAGKEAIVGAMAALEFRMNEDIPAWTAEQDRKVGLILDQLAGIPGLGLSIDPDPNGCPFSRARLDLDPAAAGHSAQSLTDALADGDPVPVQGRAPGRRVQDRELRIRALLPRPEDRRGGLNAYISIFVCHSF